MFCRGYYRYYFKQKIYSFSSLAFLVFVLRDLYNEVVFYGWSQSLLLNLMLSATGTGIVD